MSRESSAAINIEESHVRPVARNRQLTFTPAEWIRLAGLYGFIAFLHILGWGLFTVYSARYPTLAGLGVMAYLFGLRHAFDADHISAVDDTVRYMLQKRKKPLSIGFFFSLGHSTIVLALSVAIALSATGIKHELPFLQHMGSVAGAGISGAFLWIIGFINLLVLVDMIKIWGQAKTGTHSHTHLEELLSQRGLMNRLFGGRLQKLINHSWQIYPVGLLFGLGFDTASEVGLLAMTAGASASTLPAPAILSLPVLFAAGMSLMDTTDGVLMVQAYNWAFLNPVRKLYYNITTTGLSVAVALIIGTIELLQVFTRLFQLQGPYFDWLQHFDFGVLGYIIVGIFLITWALSVGIWKAKHLERYCDDATVHTHNHAHDVVGSHSHKHIH